MHVKQAHKLLTVSVIKEKTQKYTSQQADQTSITTLNLAALPILQYYDLEHSWRLIHQVQEQACSSPAIPFQGSRQSRQDKC